MSNTKNSKLKDKLKYLEKRLDDVVLNVKTCRSEQQDSITNQTKKIANLEKKLQTLKVKLKKGNEKIKLLETKLEAPEDTQSRKSQDTRISEPEIQSCGTGVTKRRLNYDVLAASEFSRSQVSFTGRLTRSSTPFQLNEDDLLSTKYQRTIQSPVSSSAGSRDVEPKTLTKDTISAASANEEHKNSNMPSVKKRKISDLVETWMEENNVLESIGKGGEDEVQQEPEQNKINQQVNEVHVKPKQNDDMIQQKTVTTVISTVDLNSNSISSEVPKNDKSNKQKSSARKTKKKKRKLTTKLVNTNEERKEQSKEVEEEGSQEKAKTGVYICELCTQSFMDSLSLQQHLQTSHSDAEAEYICQVCKRTFFKANDFYLHVKSHQVPKNDLKCSFCSKVFKKKRILKNHEMIHRNIEPYKCEKCAKKFYARGPLQRHQVKCLGETQVYTCDTCKATFCNQKNWRSHIKKHNEEKLNYSSQVEINNKNDILERD